MLFYRPISLIILALTISFSAFAQTDEMKAITTSIDNASTPEDAEVKLSLFHRFQHYNARVKSERDHFDKHINSPKSVKFSPDGKKMYIQSLEGYETVVYSAETMTQENAILHKFDTDDAHLFKENTAFDYQYQFRKSNFNVFSGKPVESTFSHNGKYLWVTYYRRSFDLNAVSPSAVAIINTENDSIVRVMPTGPLPKMIATSPDNKYVAVTHWGDNTVIIINIDSEDPQEFDYAKHLIVDYKMKLDFNNEEKVDRDNGCGFCLRGTTFTPDSKYLLIGRMGGNGGIAVFNMDSLSYLGSVYGMKINVRHMVIKNGELIISCNIPGYVQKTNLDDFIAARISSTDKRVNYTNWKSVFAGKGMRTIAVSPDGKYIFACANNENKISVIRSDDMKVISSIDADSFPVGMDISPDGSLLGVTSQGRSKYGGGNSFMLFKIEYP